MDEYGVEAGAAASTPDVSSVNVDPAQVPSERPAEEPNPDGNLGTDILYRGLVGGAEQAARGTYSTVKAVGDAVGAKLPDLPEESLVEAPEGIAGQITRDVTQFGLGFIGGMNLLKIGGMATKLPAVAKEILASGIGTGVVADPTAPRLSNLIQKYPFLENPVTEYLAQDDKDGVGESKFKAALEDMMMTPAALVLFKTVKALKNALKGNGDEATKLSDEILQDARGVNSMDDALEVPEVKVTPENAAPDLVEDVVKPAVEITSPSGKVMFKLSDDESKAFDAHLNYIVSNGHLEDVFNFPAFKSFNAARSEAMPETQEMLDGLVQYIKPKLDGKMGAVKQHAEVEKFADLLQEDPKVLYARLQQSAKVAQDLDATIVAAKGLTYSLARETRALATKVHFGTATAEDKAALELSQQRLADVFGMTLQIRKGAARATSAGKISTGESDLEELSTMLALTKDEKEALGVLKAKTLLGKLIDAHNEIWINGILSSPKTHVVNIVSAATQSLLMPFNKVVGGAILRDPQQIREGFALYNGLRTNIFDSMEMAARSFKTEKAILDPGKSTDQMTEKAVAMSGDTLFGKGVNFLGTVARIPGRFLKAEDEFFKQMNYRSKVMADASREASDLVTGGKLDPKKMVDYTDGTTTTKISEVEKYKLDRFNAAFSPSGVGADGAAQQYAREVTFTQDLNGIKTYTDWGNFGASIQRLASSHPWLRGSVLPFVKVPTNILRAAGDYTPPIAALKKEGMDILTGAETDPGKKTAFVGRLTTGSMLWTSAIMMAYEGRITGSAFGDKDMRNRQMESGWQPYSIVFEGENGKKEYVSFQRLDPVGMFFGLAADFAYLGQHITDTERDNWATSAALSIAKNLSSKSYLQGVVEMASMLGGGYTAEEQAKRMVQMRAASYLPNYLNLYTGNDELKEIRSVTDALMAKTPGMSSQVEAKRDYFGEKRVAPMGYPWNNIDPFPQSEEKDKVRNELARLSRSEVEARFTMPDVKLGVVDLGDPKLKNATGQTPYDRWTELIGKVEIGGKTFHDKLEQVMESQRYKDGTDGTSMYHAGNRVVMIRNEQERYREKALRDMLTEYDQQYRSGALAFSLRDMVRQDKRNEQAVRHGKTDRVKDILNFGQ